MGQVPKKILYAESGTQLSFRINNESKKISEEAADQAAAEEAKRLVDAGELRASDVTAFMNAHASFKNRSRAGEYAIDTAGKDAIVGASYTGANDFGTQEGKEGTEASQRSTFGSRFTKKPRRDNQADIEAVYLRTMLPKIGGISLSTDEAGKVDADKAALKAKTDQEASDALEAGKWKTVVDPYKYIGDKYFAGNLDFGETLSKMSPEEREGILKDYSQHITSNWMKYEPLKNTDVSWMGKHKGETGEINYGQPFYKDLFSRLFTSRGSKFIDSMYGTPEEGAPATPEEAKSNLADWNTLKTRKDAVVIDENTIQAPEIEDMAIGGKRMLAQYKRDPKTGIVTKQYAEYPTNQRHGLAAEAPKGDVTRQYVQDIFHPEIAESFRFYQQAPRYNKPLGTYDISDNNILQDVSNPQNILKYVPIATRKEGGVLVLQTGGTAGERAAREGIAAWLARPDIDKKKDNTSYSKPTAQVAPSTSPTTTAKATKEGVASTKLPGSDNSAKFSEMKFNTADTLEASSLLADLTSLGASFVPGGSLVAGATGLAGTGAAMAAEAARGELGWEDTGKYIMSGALDVAAFLPGAGIAAKMAKLSSKAPVVVKLLGNAAELATLGAGINMGVQEIHELKAKINKEGFSALSVQDVKNLVGALTSVVNATHMRASRKSTTMAEPTHRVMGQVKDKKGNVVETLISKQGDKWVPVSDKFKDFKVVEKKSFPVFGKKQQVVPKELTVSAPILKKEGFSFKSPMASLKDKYSAKARTSLTQGPKAPKGFDEAAESAKMVATDKKVATQASRNTKKAPVAEKEVRVKDYLEDRKARQNAIEEIRKGAGTGYTLLRDPATKKYMKLANSKTRYQETLGEFEKRKGNPKWMREEIMPKFKKGMLKDGGKIPMGQDGWIANLLGKSGEYKVGANSPSLVDAFKSNFSAVPFGEEEFKGVPNEVKFQAGENLGLPRPVASVTPSTYNLRTIPNVPTSTIQAPTGGINSVLSRNVPPALNSGALQSKVFTPTDYSIGDNAFLKSLNFLNPSNTRIGYSSKYTSKPTEVSLGDPKNPTIFDKIKGSIGQNPKAAIAASEFFRTAFLNKAIKKQTNPLYIPPVTDKVETPWREGGDLLTRSAFYNRAAQMQGANRFPNSSDATFNLMKNLAVGDKAEELRSQGDLAFAQGLDKNREMAFRVNEANAESRKQAADQRGMYATKAQAAKDEADKEKDALIASNWNTYWASTNLDKKRDLLTKGSKDQYYKMQEARNEVETRPEFAILNKTGVDENSEEYKRAFRNYSKALLDAERSVYLRKSGGTSEEFKHLKEMRKERMAINKETAKIANKWQQESSKQIKKEALSSSKELRNLISKIFSK